MSGDIDALREQLAAAGRDRDEVVWSDDPERSRIDGTYVLSRQGEGVVVSIDERGKERPWLTFADEVAAADYLRDLLLNRPPVQKLHEEQLAEARRRMQEKARRALSELEQRKHE